MFGLKGEREREREGERKQQYKITVTLVHEKVVEAVKIKSARYYHNTDLIIIYKRSLTL